jgi:hypothetical protein
MATIQELQKKVDILEKGLKNKAVKADAKAKAKIQISKLKEQIADMKKKQTAKGGKKYTKVLSKIKKQTGGTSKKQDGERPAKPVGKRVSSTGNTYYETRANRSDVRQPSKRVPVGQRFGGGGMIKKLNDIESKIKNAMKENNKWHFIDEEIDGKRIQIKMFVGSKEVDVQIFRINGLSATMPKNYVGKRETLKMIMNNIMFTPYTLSTMADGGETYGNGGTTDDKYVVYGVTKVDKDIKIIRDGIASYKSADNFLQRFIDKGLDDEFGKMGIMPKSKFEKEKGYLKYADGGAITNIGGTQFSTEDLSGMFANGGELHRTMGNQYGLGGEISDGFTIRGIKDLLNKQFPDSFGFKVFPHKFGTTSSPDYDKVKSALYGLEDSDIKQKLYFPPYQRDHEINFSVHQGGENTYFNFLLMAEDGNYYVGTFGFKDRGDVSSDYITKFLAFLMEAYGLPFRVNHEIYAQGGMTEHGLRKGDTILDKSMFSNDKVVVRDDDGNYAVVDLDKGERYEDKNK